MIEIRWVYVGGGKLQLQKRTRLPRVDSSGAFCDFAEWSDWSAVPIVHGAQHACSVIDIFDSGNGI
jgi:hypothetical protein